jgi:hypothetical protein
VLETHQRPSGLALLIQLLDGSRLQLPAAWTDWPQKTQSYDSYAQTEAGIVGRIDNLFDLRNLLDTLAKAQSRKEN